jgi:phospholipid transport system substrate-binding protein
MMWKSTLAAVALGLLVSLAHGDAPDPTATIKRATDQLITVINQGKTYFDKDPERYYKSVREVLEPTVDFDKFAQGVMAVYYKRATPEQRQRFVETFKSGLIHTYAKALLDFGNEKIDVLPSDRPRTKPDRDNVKMEVHSNDGKVYPVLYSMLLSQDGSWRIYNIIINGINMGLTYRNQFASLIKAPDVNGNMDAAISRWGETIAHIDPMKQGNPEGGDGATQAAAPED